MINLPWAFILILGGGLVFGRLAEKLRLPGVLGMTLWGIALRFFLYEYWPQEIHSLAPFLKSVALVVILLRAGLGLKRKTLAKIGSTAILMALLPMLFEAGAWFLMARAFLGFGLWEAGILAFLISAVSPAVVVPSMLELQEKGLGREREVPTLVLAGASLDDVFSIAGLTLFLGLASNPENFSPGDLLRIPFSLILGTLLGVVLGFLLAWVFRKWHHRIRATEKVIILLGFSLMLLQVGDLVQIASLLGIMASGFVLLEKTPVQAKEIALKLSKIWVLAAILLFVLIGLAVDLPLALEAGATGLLLLFFGLVARSLGVLAATAFSPLNWKERLFCVIAYLPKATVQAAFGTMALDRGLESGALILSLAVLSIVVTAPLGLLGIKVFGTKLLSLPYDSIKGELSDQNDQ